jgi:hypothetical protein
MSDPPALIPISDAQAKAIEEALKTLRAGGSALREILGTVPEDVVALLGGNWLKVKRAENLLRTIAKAQERLKRDGIKAEPASLSIGLPLLAAAADESRDELQEIWAGLLAAAADPARSKAFRVAFIEAAKGMDPIDALLLKAIQHRGGRATNADRDSVAAEMHIPRDQLDVSIDNLKNLRVLMTTTAGFYLTAFGREFLRSL